MILSLILYKHRGNKREDLIKNDNCEIITCCYKKSNSI